MFDKFFINKKTFKRVRLWYDWNCYSNNDF